MASCPDLGARSPYSLGSTNQSFLDRSWSAEYFVEGYLRLTEEEVVQEEGRRSQATAVSGVRHKYYELSEAFGRSIGESDETASADDTVVRLSG
jgi:hypothetical protein